ncbi:MAG TPA: hypothetical protein VFD57_07045 [Clostridia bacterium]|nr:hypothetical protein [Clostridia bacterium]
MHKEYLKSTKDGSHSTIITSIGLVIILIVIVGISNLAYNRYDIPYTGYVTFALYIGIGIYVYRKMIRKYEYLLIKDELILGTAVGTKSKEIIKVPIKDILYFCPLPYERLDKTNKYKNLYLTFNRRAQTNYVLATNKDAKVYRVIFDPSKELIDLIKNKK